MRFSAPAVLFAAIASMTLSAPAMAQHEGMHGSDHHSESEMAAKPVNAMCPIGKEAIDPDTPTAMHKGKAVGFCCAGCNEKFMAWGDEAKDKFVTLAVAHSEPGYEEGVKKMAIASQRVGDPYLLNTCPISGEELGGMGDSVVKVYDGREVRLCCKMCISKFEKNQAASFAKIDEQIIASQLPYYPLTTCVVSGEELTGSDMEAINVVFNNRLVRLCCKGCVADLKESPDSFMSKIDQAVIAQQSADYPLTTCPVSDEELIEDEVVNYVAGNRLYKFCCKMCKKKFKDNPTAVTASLDAAWAEQGGFKH